MDRRRIVQRTAPQTEKEEESEEKEEERPPAGDESNPSPEGDYPDVAPAQRWHQALAEDKRVILNHMDALHLSDLVEFSVYDDRWESAGSGIGQLSSLPRVYNHGALLQLIETSGSSGSIRRHFEMETDDGVLSVHFCSGSAQTCGFHPRQGEMGWLHSDCFRVRYFNDISESWIAAFCTDRVIRFWGNNKPPGTRHKGSLWPTGTGGEPSSSRDHDMAPATTTKSAAQPQGRAKNQSAPRAAARGRSRDPVGRKAEAFFSTKDSDRSRTPTIRKVQQLHDRVTASGRRAPGASVADARQASRSTRLPSEQALREPRDQLKGTRAHIPAPPVPPNRDAPALPAERARRPTPLPSPRGTLALDRPAGSRQRRKEAAAGRDAANVQTAPAHRYQAVRRLFACPLDARLARETQLPPWPAR